MTLTKGLYDSIRINAPSRTLQGRELVVDGSQGFQAHSSTLETGVSTLTADTLSISDGVDHINVGQLLAITVGSAVNTYYVTGKSGLQVSV